MFTFKLHALLWIRLGDRFFQLFFIILVLGRAFKKDIITFKNIVVHLALQNNSFALFKFRRLWVMINDLC